MSSGLLVNFSQILRDPRNREMRIFSRSTRDTACAPTMFNQPSIWWGVASVRKAGGKADVHLCTAHAGVVTTNRTSFHFPGTQRFSGRRTWRTLSCSLISSHDVGQVYPAERVNWPSLVCGSRGITNPFDRAWSCRARSAVQRTALALSPFNGPGLRDRDAMAVLDAVLPAGADLVADNTGAAAIHHLPVRSAAGLRSRSARALRATPSGRVSEGHLCRQRHTVVIAGRRLSMHGIKKSTPRSNTCCCEFMLFGNHAQAYKNRRSHRSLPWLLPNLLAETVFRRATLSSKQRDNGTLSSHSPRMHRSAFG